MSEVRISEIGKEFYLVRTKEKELHRNIYFKRFVNNGNQVNMIFDPGTKLDSDIVMDVSEKLFGGLQNIDIIFLSHQDPDVSSLTPIIMAGAKKSVLITSVDTFRLVGMYGIPKERAFLVENFNSEVVTIKKTGHKVRFVPAHYCHFRGAQMFYDYESRILFSGDFGAGVNSRNGNGFLATEESWEGIKTFHTIYMPNNLAVKETVSRIGLLKPIPDAIAPQHGDIIPSGLLIDFMKRLENMDVGIDHLKKKEPQKELLLNALSDTMNRIKQKYPDKWDIIKDKLNEPGQFTTVFNIGEERILDIKINHIDALKHFIGVIERVLDPANASDIKVLMNFELEKHNVMIPLSVMSKLKTQEVSGKDFIENLLI